MSELAIYKYVPHRRTQEKLSGLVPPVKAADLIPHEGFGSRFNARLAVKITGGVGTMFRFCRTFG